MQIKYWEHISEEEQQNFSETFCLIRILEFSLSHQIKSELIQANLQHLYSTSYKPILEFLNCINIYLKKNTSKISKIRSAKLKSYAMILRNSDDIVYSVKFIDNKVYFFRGLCTEPFVVSLNMHP